MTSFFSSDYKLGILGGGQLGKMLLYECRKWDLQTLVMDKSADAPARLAAHTFVQGNILDPDEVFEFGKDLDVITIEIENISLGGLQRLQDHGVKVRPGVKSLEILTNKVIQKRFYADKGFPTSSFSFYDDLESLQDAEALGRLEIPFVWKSARMGYDGKGVKIVKNKADLELLSDGPCLAEELVDIEKELAMTVARRPSGDVEIYPMVEMSFHPVANLVELVFSPAHVTSALEAEAREICMGVAKELELEGLLAIEFFLTKSGRLLVNEAAPRTHNSGHLTIEGNFTNQFDQHLRTVLDLPLGSTELKIPAAMINLVGEDGHEGPVYYEGISEAYKCPGAAVHIYGKKETRPFRKMGHITVVDRDLPEAMRRANELREKVRVLSSDSLLF